MKRVLTITLLFVTLLPCVNAFAGERCNYGYGTAKFYSTEEYTAPWEREAYAALMGEAVLKDFRNSKNDTLKMNVFCSVKSMNELNRIRDKFLSIIETEGSGETATDEGLLASRILEKAASADITGLTNKEKIHLKRIRSLPEKNNGFKTEGFAGGAASQNVAALLMPGLVINSTGSGFSFSSESVHRSGMHYYALKINPVKSFEIVHADYYRLFLYMRDDAGDSDFNEITYSSPPDFTQLFNPLTSFKQIRKLQQAAVLQKEKNLPSSITSPLRKSAGIIMLKSIFNFNRTIPEDFYEEA